VLESIETLAHRIGLPVSMGAIDVSEIKASIDESDAMHISEGTPLIKVSRVINAEGRPVAFLTDVLPMNILSESALKAGFTGSVLDLMLKMELYTCQNHLPIFRLFQHRQRSQRN
jgi:GntR family transcriptional regulator